MGEPMTDRLFDFDHDPEHDPFAERHGVPVDVLDTPDPESPVDYLRLGAGVTRDREFRAFRRSVGPLALGWWTALLILAKRDGAFGVLDLDEVELAVEATGDATLADDVLGVLEAAQRARLVWLRERDGVVTIRVRKWREWQTKSPRDRQRLKRAKERDARPSVTPPRDSHAPASQSRPAVTVTPQHSTRLNDDENGSEVERVRVDEPEWGDAWRDMAAELRRIYPDPAEHVPAMRALMYDSGMRRVPAAAMTYGVRHTADAMDKRPGWAPDELVPFVVSIAKRYRPDAAPVPRPTPKERTDADRPRFQRDPELARFDA